MRSLNYSDIEEFLHDDYLKILSFLASAKAGTEPGMKYKEGNLSMRGAELGKITQIRS
jgi:hypothetical protein